MFTALAPKNTSSSSLNFSGKKPIRTSSEFSYSPTREKLEAQVKHNEKKSWQKWGQIIVEKLRNSYKFIVDYKRNRKNN
jgi:hypothetical protein